MNNEWIYALSIQEKKNVELIEFKKAEYNAAYPKTIQNVESEIIKAANQVNSITGIHHNEIANLDWTIKRVAGVIGLPAFETGTLKEREDAIQDLKNSSYDVKAWVFSEEYLKIPSNREKGKFYPGTFLVASSV